MNLAKIKEIVENEVCNLIFEKTSITVNELINEDYLNEYDSDELDKSTKLFYSVMLKSPFSEVLNGSATYDLVYDVNLHLQTKEHENMTSLLLFLKNDKEIVKRFKDESNKMKINIRNVALLEQKFFTHLSETFYKEVITFEMIYEEEYKNGNI